MTAKEVYNAILTEMNKTASGTLDLEDFNYFFNKAINQFVNKRYNLDGVNQQVTDDLRVLKASTTLDPVSDMTQPSNITSLEAFEKSNVEFVLPADYLHLTGCIVNYQVLKDYKCYNKDDYCQFNAKRATEEIVGQLLDNFYFRPTYKRPYYILINENTSNLNPTNPVTAYGDSDTAAKAASSIQISGTDAVGKQTNTIAVDGTITINNPNFPRTLKLSDGTEDSLIEKTAGHRYGNISNVRMEVLYGKDKSIFKLKNVKIYYIKAPQYIRFTQEQLDLTEDTSQELEFPNYICQEIINELTNIIMENSSNPRLQTHPVMSQSIASPSQAQDGEPSKTKK